MAALASACGAMPPAATAAPAVVSTVTLAPVQTQVAPSPVPAALLPTDAPSLTPAPTSRVFTVAVIVDTLSEPVRREQADAVVREASGLLQPLSDTILLMTDLVEDGTGGSTHDMASRYISAHASALPNGIVIFSFGDGAQAKLYGGYSYAIAAPVGFRNAFASPVAGNGQLYVAIVHFSHRYAACGYGGADTVQSTTSVDGECRNQPGSACTQHNGYSMCSDSVAHLYASTGTYFVSSTIVHELLHSFSPGGDQDHYSTPECNGRMGYPAGFFDLQESQYYNGLCPDIYQAFTHAHEP